HLRGQPEMRHRAPGGAITRERVGRRAIDLPERDVVPVARGDRGEHAGPPRAPQTADGRLRGHGYVPATRTRLRPAFFAANSARSADERTRGGSTPSSGNDRAKQ